MEFSYVYILQSQCGEHFYSGLTDDLKDRLRRHNGGEVPHTAKFRPWRIKTAIAFTDRQRAASFERYLKSASGRAFIKETPLSLRSELCGERRLPRRSPLLGRRWAR